jgi:predicted phosphodiesterase
MWLICGDLHLTDQAKDAYRFGIFDWIKRQQDQHPVAATFLCGDITDAKDRHSATLVNKIVTGLTKLQPPVYVCMGNHDYRDPKNPFFKFLNHIEGIRFVIKPEAIHGMAIIPHYREQTEFNHAVSNIGGMGHPDAFLVHQTFDGAIAETGARLTGLASSPIELLKPPLGVYAGDVHKPQTQGIVTYVGCPYHVRFGDAYRPRVLWVTKDADTNLYFPAPKKWSLTVRGPENLDPEKLKTGDQVKLTIEIAREETVDWKSIKADTLAKCQELGLEVHGVKLQINTTKQRKRIPMAGKTNSEIMESFCETENLPIDIRTTGRRIFDGYKDIL